MFGNTTGKIEDCINNTNSDVFALDYYFHYFQIQCFEGSFLIENLFLFIIITANLLTDILKYLAKILGELF